MSRRHVYNHDAPRTGPGVYTMDDVKDRCKVDDLTGCWIWGMSSAERLRRTFVRAGVAVSDVAPSSGPMRPPRQFVVPS